MYSSVESFKAESPYTDMLPTWSEFFRQPLASAKLVYEVWDLTVLYQTAQTAELRKKETDDMSKRAQYRKAHGLEDGVFSVKEDVQALTQPPPVEKKSKFLGIF